MELKNTTKWDNRDIRKLFMRCIYEVEKVEQPNFRFRDAHKRYTLKIQNGRSFRGRAVYGGRWSIGLWMFLRIPRAIEFGEKEKTSLARLIIHEYYHNLGFKNWDYKGYKNDGSKTWDVAWVKDYQIREKEVKVATKPDIQRIRYERALKNLENAKSKFKRAKNLFKKWEAKVKYYERVYAKKGNGLTRTR